MSLYGFCNTYIPVHMDTPVHDCINVFWSARLHVGGLNDCPELPNGWRVYGTLTAQISGTHNSDDSAQGNTVESIIGLHLPMTCAPITSSTPWPKCCGWPQSPPAKPSAELPRPLAASLFSDGPTSSSDSESETPESSQPCWCASSASMSTPRQATLLTHLEHWCHRTLRP